MFIVPPFRAKLAQAILTFLEFRSNAYAEKSYMYYHVLVTYTDIANRQTSNISFGFLGSHSSDAKKERKRKNFKKEKKRKKVT